MAEGVDYAWSKPSASKLKDAGKVFACRYLSHDPSKDLTLAEANALASAGIWSVVVWETTASRATGTFTAGAEDAKLALQLANALGMPAGRPIYFAVDVDVAGAAVKTYFQGVTSILGAARTGVYGGIKPVTYLAQQGLATWFWQTLAWSGGQWFTGNHIEQYAIEKTVAGVAGVDLNRSKQADYGQWMPGKGPVTTVALSKDDITSITKSVWNTDGILDSPASRQADDKAAGRTVNAYWAAKSYLKEIYDMVMAQSDDTAGAVDAVMTKVDDLTAKVDALAAKIDGLSTGGGAATVDAKAVVQELARVLSSQVGSPPAPPAAG